MKRRLHLLLIQYYFVAGILHGSKMATEAANNYFNEKLRLVQKLTNNSGTIKEILPARDLKSSVNVQLKISLRQISKVDEKNQAIRLTVWLTFYWNNPYLKWDPHEYSGIDSVHANNEYFWLPDVALYNEASLEEEIDVLFKRLSTKIIIKNNGDCTWMAPATLLSQCKINVAHFPFDEQNCAVIIGSWTYSESKLNISYYKEDVELDNFIPNGAWEVKKAVLKNLRNTYENGVVYPEVVFDLRIQRLSLYYGLNIIIPCALISMLALLSFILPSNHGERMSLVITILLALSVYMLIVSSSLPETSDAVPVLGSYCFGVLMTVASCLIATSLTLKFHNHINPMPRWLDVLIQKLAKYMLVRVEKDDKGGEITIDHKSSISFHNPEFHNPSDESVVPNDETNLDSVSPLMNISEKSKTMEESLLEEVKQLTRELHLRKEHESNAKKWKVAAKVMDRFSLVVFSVVYSCLIIYLLSFM
ncbi:neuronal acetylcholine receptor subunit alpha-7-like [Xenia sp. Carnegie-2017]|uniref:neuronal acetylcholine receptor subunit alpha-7-like n=1 Tax=Xenia sp. Carnegie-2017 TaxID=2897299 RepID=UPI001F034835|nr:neuronal acetylcholine receptor subunit alpha-7-like [Xenia sp. Carnegie-2017]XP_046842940.1 neuronal acetylcholine receptor subunit alpha-7-like [Xenia sp. Carnegie-2017]XP_046842941.1 neuronal acetylcholine receptor subunit alpha-7-like [Xenia sp. Carnegie-2017]